MQVQEIINRLRNDRYYILWIEGLSAKNGEKLASLNPREYTTLNTRALRFTKRELVFVVPKLIEAGIASWVFEQISTYYPLTYVPTGTRNFKI
jgi:hypothetical protein